MDYYRYYAELAEAAEEFSVAADWLAPALDLVPGDAELARQQMLYLHHAGRVQEAIVVGERASRACPRDEGMADFYVAVFYMELHDAAKHDQARIHLERALAREPRLARLAWNDPIFRPLHGPEFSAMAEEAFRRIGVVMFPA